MIADDTPAAPAEGRSATYFVTSAVSWPAGLEWSTDPDGDVAPTITGTALVSMFTLGGVTRAVLGATYPAQGVTTTTTTAAGTTTTTTTSGTNFAPSLTLGTATVTDLNVSQPFTTFDTEGTTVTTTADWGDGSSPEVVTSPATHTYAAAGSFDATFTPNDGTQDGVTRTATYITNTPQTAATILDSFNRANSATGLGVTDTGETWVQLGSGVVGVSNNQAYRATSNALAVVDFGQADMKVSSKIGVNGEWFSGPIARCDATATKYYYVDVMGSGGAFARISWVTDGNRANGAGVPGATGWAGTTTGDILALSCKEVAGGTELKLYRNGVLLQTLTDSNAARPITGTYAGIAPWNSSTIRVDDFRVDPA